MRSIPLLIGCILLVCISGCTSVPGPVEEQQSFDELVAFVQNAFEYILVHGKEEAIRAFNDPDGPFVDGEFYIFAYEDDGTTLVLPFQPELIGTDRFDLQDSEGRYFIREIIETARSGGGIVRYRYPDPSRDFAVGPKLSYVMRGGEGWVIGSGMYTHEEPDLPTPATREALIRFVSTAAAYARDVGQNEAVATFNDRSGPFVRGDLYIYAGDMQGNVLALPHQPGLIGTSRIDLQDSHGVNITRVKIGLARLGGGVIFFDYPDPTMDMQLQRKMSYILGVDDEWWVAAGVYLTGESTIASEAAMMEANALLITEVLDRLTALDQDLAEIAIHASRVGINDPSTADMLARAADGATPLIDIVIIDAGGVIRLVALPGYESIIGLDISAQPHIQRVLNEGLPTLSLLFVAVEGPEAIALAHPITGADGRVVGGVSAIFSPEILISEAVDAAGDHHPWTTVVIQTDGRILYTGDDEIAGLLFSDDDPATTPERERVLERIRSDSSGADCYHAEGIHLVWDSATLHGSTWRISKVGWI